MHTSFCGDKEILIIKRLEKAVGIEVKTAHGGAHGLVLETTKPINESLIKAINIDAKRCQWKVIKVKRYKILVVYSHNSKVMGSKMLMEDFVKKTFRYII